MLAGKKLNKIHEPSSGGIGIKLKIASQIFIATIYVMQFNILDYCEIIESGINLKINPKTIAMQNLMQVLQLKLLISPYFLSVKLYGFIGTGFAQPNKNGLSVQ